MTHNRSEDHDVPYDPALQEAFDAFIQQTQVPFDFHERVMVRVQQRRSRWKLLKGLWMWWTHDWSPRWVWAATICVLLSLTFNLGLGYYTWKYRQVIGLRSPHRPLAATRHGGQDPQAPRALGADTLPSATSFIEPREQELSDENKDSAMRIRTVFEIPRPPPGPASDLFNKAESARSNGLYDKALTLYNAAIQAGSTDVRVYLQAGHLYTVKGQYQEAVAVYSQGLQNNAESARSNSLAGHLLGEVHQRALYAGLARVYSKQGYGASDVLAQADAALQQGLYDEALTLYNAVIQVEPTNGRAYLQSGLLYAKKGKFEEAMEVFSKGIQKTSDSSLRQDIHHSLDLISDKRGVSRVPTLPDKNYVR